MDNLADTASLLWKEVSREARTSIGRRLSSSSKSRPIEKPPPGAHGLVLQEDDDGWDVVERKDDKAKNSTVPEREEAVVKLAASYIISNEEGYEEEPEYRAAWDLPDRPAKKPEPSGASCSSLPLAHEPTWAPAAAPPSATIAAAVVTPSPVERHPGMDVVDWPPTRPVAVPPRAAATRSMPPVDPWLKAGFRPVPDEVLAALQPAAAATPAGAGAASLEPSPACGTQESSVPLAPSAGGISDAGLRPVRTPPPHEPRRARPGPIFPPHPRPVTNSPN